MSYAVDEVNLFCYCCGPVYDCEISFLCLFCTSLQ